MRRAAAYRVQSRLFRPNAVSAYAILGSNLHYRGVGVLAQHSPLANARLPLTTMQALFTP